MISSQSDKLRELAKAFPETSQRNTLLMQSADLILELRDDLQRVNAENAKLRELLSKVYGYYVSGTLTPCDFCDKYCCEGDASTTCKSDEYDPDGIVVKEVERRMRELRIEVKP